MVISTSWHIKTYCFHKNTYACPHALIDMASKGRLLLIWYISDNRNIARNSDGLGIFGYSKHEGLLNCCSTGAVKVRLGE